MYYVLKLMRCSKNDTLWKKSLPWVFLLENKFWNNNKIRSIENKLIPKVINKIKAEMSKTKQKYNA